jgi:hypothetical protein
MRPPSSLFYHKRTRPSRFFGSDLYIVNANGGHNQIGSIGEYTVNGAVVNAALIPNFVGPVAIAMAPEPRALSVLAAAGDQGRCDPAGYGGRASGGGRQRVKFRAEVRSAGHGEGLGIHF